MRPHLVVGASGLIGEHLSRAAEQAGAGVVGTYHSHAIPGLRHLDIRDRENVELLFAEIGPAVVYLTAALPNVDRCETNPEETWETNVLGVRHVVGGARSVGAKLVYFSSDYVFDGKAGPYREDEPAHPICEYGRQKLMAEHYVALNASNYLIIRTTVVYGWERQGKNFICRLLNVLGAGQVLRVPHDQLGNPTYAPNLVRVVLELVGAGSEGLFHVVGPDRVSRYEFAREAASVFGLDERLVQPVATSQLGQAAPRPLNAGMMVEKVVAAQTVPLTGYKEGLRALASTKESER